jgi:hypothetical protein
MAAVLTGAPAWLKVGAMIGNSNNQIAASVPTDLNTSPLDAAVRGPSENRKEVMKRHILVAGLIAVLTASALAATAFASGSPYAAAACVPGVKKINGVNARTFCGPAKAAVKINGSTVSYKGGECSKGIGLFTVNIGTVVLGNLKNKPEYLGVTATAKVGVQSRQTVAVVHAGKSKSIVGTVTLKAGLKSGTFSGKVFGSSAVISGSFTC